MIEIIQEKLRQYGATNAVEEENAIKEIVQEIALYALWHGDFFDVAFFQGGTSLRILHRLDNMRRGHFAVVGNSGCQQRYMQRRHR